MKIFRSFYFMNIIDVNKKVELYILILLLKRNLEKKTYLLPFMFIYFAKQIK